MSAIEELAALEALELEEANAAKKGSAEEAARVELANRKVLRELKSKVAVPIQRIDTDAGMVVIKRVSPEQYKHFLTIVIDEEQRASANEVLNAAAVIHPPPDVWDEWRSKFPALGPSVSKVVIDFNGGTVRGKKA